MDGARAAARGNAGDVSRGGARQDSPEFGDFEVPGVGSRCGLAWERARGTLNPPKWFAQGCRGCSSELGTGGGFARRGSPAYRCSGHWNGLRPTKTSTKVEGTVLKLTEGSDQTGTAHREVGGVDRQRRWAEHGDEVDAGVRRAPGLHGSTCGETAKQTRGSGWPDLRRRRAIARR